MMTDPALDTSHTGREILAHDWSRFAIGAPKDWPRELTAIVSMMLACPTPMFLAWGPDLNALYNDAYRPILGRRLDHALGMPFRELWGDIWEEIGPLVDRTLAGESATMTDMQLDLRRQGVPEESWWSFTYSPVFDADGRVAGLFCVTGETTARVIAERERGIAAERLNLALSAGNSIGAWDWDVVNDRVVADTRFAVLYGVDPDVAAAGAPIGTFFHGIHPDDLPDVEAAVARTVSTGEPFLSEYRLIDGGRERWVSAQGRCIFDGDGRCIRFPGVSFDITERKTAELAIAAARDERDFVVALSAEQRTLASPEAILRRSLEALGKWLGVDRCGFYRQLPTGRVRYGPCWTNALMAPVVGEIAGDRFGVRMQRCRERGIVLAYADARSDPIGGLDELAGDGVVAGICQPILRDGRFVAGFFLHVAEVRAWTASELALVREVAELTMLTVERAEALIRLENRVGQQEDALVQQAGELREQAAGRSAAEDQVRQLQKMEAVGQLTGGIAHDFNNMLAVIIGGINLMQRRIERGDTDVGKYADAAMEGATRAAALTQRLLAFSRQSPLAPEPIDLNRMTGGLTELLTRTLGERVRLETVLGAGLWKAHADPNQLENAIINLAVNARDAMPDGGRLTIETGNAHLDEVYAADEGLNPGQYVLLGVSDTGTGMTTETLSRAFEPFFTTKAVGKGTGLGLSQVFGFARQSGGHVKIYTELGHGTTFKIYLPRFFGEAMPAPVKRTAAVARGGSPEEVILVVEDEDRLRNFTTEALRELGYTVVHAANGAEALAMIRGGQGADLLFTDIVMPGMTGRQLAEEAAGLIPGLRIVYTTGYTRNAVVHNGTLDPGTNFLAKPFGFDQLAAKIRQVLDEDA